MALRTQLFQQLPWTGGVNTAVDESMIGPNQLVQADNVVFDTRGSRKKRDGMDFGFDNGDDGSASIVGLHEFYFGEQTRVQRLMSVNSARQIFSYTSGGIKNPLTDQGFPWSGTLDNASFITFNNRCMIAVPGNNNLIKKWRGTGQIDDLRNILNQKLKALGRSSVGTTRTLVFEKSFQGQNGDYIVVQNTTGVNASKYNGTYKITSVSTTVVNNDTVTYTAAEALTEAPFTDLNLIVDGVAPMGSILREHLGRLWTNDKLNKDRLHYSGSFQHEQWLGFGDSAAIDIGVGDGDPEGITAIFPTFKGELFVAKRTKLYRISGYSPETFQVSLVSNGIGCVSHNSIVAVDQDDLFFVSEKGVHSITTTSNFGDFGAAFVSADIQSTFNIKFSKPRLKNCWAAYLPTINSVAFAFTDTNLPDRSNTDLAVNNSVWLYNVPLKAWYRWPDIPCQSMIVATDGDQKRFYFGSHKNRVIKSFTGNFYDLDKNGSRVPIKRKLVTGTIYVDNQFFTVKGYKRFIFYYKPEGTHAIKVTIRVDNYLVDPANVLTFAEAPLGTLLGVDFILGVSRLGADARLGAYSQSIDGYGRGVKITIEDEGISQQAEIQGFAIEYESAGTSPELLRE
jgi:hypothetical protein